MSKTLQELNTEYWYAWERRGRGWDVYSSPVELEAPLDAYKPPSTQNQPVVDDGRVPTLVGYIKSSFSSLFKKNEEAIPEQEESEGYSYPDNPIPFESDTPLCAFRVTLPKKHEVDALEAERLLQMLSFGAAQFSFEIIGVHDGIVIQWTCRANDKDKLLYQLKAYFPSVALEEVEAYVLPFHDKTPLAIGDLGLENEFLLSLNDAPKFSLDPLIGIVATLENLAYGESGMVQILFKGAQEPWGEVMRFISTDGQGKSFFEDMPGLPKMAEQKGANLLFGVVIRVVGQGTDKGRSSEIMYNLANAIIATTQSQNNRLMLLSNGGYPFDNHLQAVYERTSYRLGMLLNSKELVQLVHMPSASVVSSKLFRNAVKSKYIPEPLRDGYYALGVSYYLNEEQLVWVNDKQRLQHTHIIGATGTGKSTFIVNLALQDCDAGNGCIVFDPHGDLIDDILPRIGQERLQDIILIDPSDTEYPIGFNLLEAKTELEKIILSSDLVETFKEKSTAWGDTMTAVLTNAINAFLESKRGGTLLELRKFLLDAKFRQTILNSVDDPAVKSYWQHEFHQLKKGSLSPLLTRIDTFLRPKIVRNMMAQKKGVDFDEILAKNKVVLVKLSQGLIGRDNSHMLGTLLLAKLYQAAQARQAISKGERTPFYCYIDEFQNYLTPTLGDILSGARKYGLGLILAHQELRQIQDTAIGNSILSNPSIRLCFRVGYNDAGHLEKGFTYFDQNDLQNLSTGEVIGRVERNDWDFHMYTDDLPTSIYDEQNREIVREQTRNLYATPVENIEAIIADLYRYEAQEPKEKPIREPKEPKPVVEQTPNPQPVVEHIPIEPAPTVDGVKDIDEAAQKFIESQVEQREQREHSYLQNFIQKLAEQRGFKAQLEAPTPDGGRVDILLTQGAIQIACELSVTNTIDYEIKNLQKCIQAGFANIAMLCPNETHLRNIKQAAKDLPDTIQFLTPDTLHLYLNTFTFMETTEKVVQGYRVQSTFKGKANPEDDAMVRSILSKALKRQNKT